MSTQDTTLAVQIGQAKISETEALALQSAFAQFLQQAEAWRDQASSIQVTSIDDKAGMQKARQARLALKEIRVNTEKVRKDLKEESLRKGKAIDGVANFIKGIIEPLEAHLQQQEDFAKIEEEKAKAALKEKRAEELRLLGVDPMLYNLGEMTDEAWSNLLESSNRNYLLQKEAAERAEQERIEREKEEAAERERLRSENERLRKENEEQQKEAERERQERERTEVELRKKQEAEQQAERERQAEERKKADEAKNAKLAPDREKLTKFADAIVAFPLPEVTSPEARAVVEKAVAMLADASKFVKQQSVNI